ncbi:MAG TPA: hypothetical protein VHF47_06340 [Acidimicrobiales bacterium]|nr:hypothetical protein [Acidimicrobiales bacterium]
MTALEQLGLAPGHPVRFRRKAGGRWSLGTAVRVEKDGSIGVRDDLGAARAIPVALIEVRTTGPRGAHTWEPLVERAARTEQLRLL